MTAQRQPVNGGVPVREAVQPASDGSTLMPRSRKQLTFSSFMLGTGAAAVLATGADHLYEYAHDGFSSVPTIGTLFLLNFIGATIIGVALLLPLARIAPRFGERLRALLAISGVGLAGTSLLALWISETSSLFGFSDYGFRATIVVAIVAESVAIVTLGAYLLITALRRKLPRTSVQAP